MQKKTFIAAALFLVTILVPSICAAQTDLHTSAGFGITIVITSATQRPKLGFAAGLAAGAGKELWDMNRRGHDASVQDFLATAAGSASAYALWKLVLNRQRPVKVAKRDLPPLSPEPKPVSPYPPRAIGAFATAPAIAHE